MAHLFLSPEAKASELGSGMVALIIHTMSPKASNISLGSELTPLLRLMR